MHGIARRDALEHGPERSVGARADHVRRQRGDRHVVVARELAQQLVAGLGDLRIAATERRQDGVAMVGRQGGLEVLDGKRSDARIAARDAAMGPQHLAGRVDEGQTTEGTFTRLQRRLVEGARQERHAGRRRSGQGRLSDSAVCCDVLTAHHGGLPAPTLHLGEFARQGLPLPVGIEQHGHAPLACRVEPAQGERTQRPWRVVADARELRQRCGRADTGQHERHVATHPESDPGIGQRVAKRADAGVAEAHQRITHDPADRSGRYASSTGTASRSAAATTVAHAVEARATSPEASAAARAALSPVHGMRVLTTRRRTGISTCLARTRTSCAVCATRPRASPRARSG